MARWSRIPKTLQFAARLSFITLVTMSTVIMVLPLSDVSFARPPTQGPGEEPAFQASSYAAADGSSVIHSQETTLTAAYFEGHGTREGLEITPDGLKLAAGATAGTYTSDPLASPMAVTTDLVPSWRATLPSGAGVKLETRLSSDGATWTEWAENPVAFYPVRDNEYGGTLIWIGSRGPVLAQVRLTLSAPNAEASPTLPYLTLVFTDASQGPSDAAIAAQMPAEAAAEICPPDKPPVATRTQWGCPDEQRSPYWWRPQPTDVTHIVVHHSATPSTFEEWNRKSPCYQINEWSAVVRAIWNYHANTLGWGDVGYNYIIDPTGQIYEGRAGSQEGQRDIVGAHDGKNQHSMGVGFIGCYGNCGYLGLQNAEPPHTMMNKGVELIAWKVGQKELDPHGQTPYHGRLTPVIAGGRDVTATYSPGDNLYNWLPWVRDAVWDRITCPEKDPCQITDIIFDEDAYKVNETIHVTAKVADPGGVPLGGATVNAELLVEPCPDPLTGASGSGDQFPLPEVIGEYRADYQAGLQGIHTFKITAEHPNFKPCFKEASVPVGCDTVVEPCDIQPGIVDPWPVCVDDPIHLQAQVTLNGQPVSDATVTANILSPNLGLEPLPLPWQGDAYRGTYGNTDMPGCYSISTTATGAGYTCSKDLPPICLKPCVVETTLGLQPSDLEMSVCSTGAETDIRVSHVENLQAFSFNLYFDPGVVEVADQDLNQAGVQIRVDNDVLKHPNLVARNQVNQSEGYIELAVTLLGAATLEGDVTLGSVHWLPKTEGQTALTFQGVTLVASGGTELIPAEIENGDILVTPDCSGVSGHCYLQGRADHSGVTVADGQGRQVRTGSDGFFSIPGGDVISVKFPGYLSARADVPALLAQGAAAADVRSAGLGSITLLAGDVNGDDIVNIYDLAYIANYYRTSDPLADLNADGTVDIIDLVLTASNYRRLGPLTDWQ
jgi:hypothetical protein